MKDSKVKSDKPCVTHDERATLLYNNMYTILDSINNETLDKQIEKLSRYMISYLRLTSKLKKIMTYDNKLENTVAKTPLSLAIYYDDETDEDSLDVSYAYKIESLICELLQIKYEDNEQPLHEVLNEELTYKIVLLPAMLTTRQEGNVLNFLCFIHLGRKELFKDD